MIETVVASVVVAVMLAAAMSLAGAAGLAQYKTGERATAGALADAMIAEITALPYADQDTTPVFGLEAGETSGVRTTYDDVDDYNGLDESAPAERSGTAVPGLTGWQRTVGVNYATVAALDTVSVTDTGLKRIVVTIKHNTTTVLTRRTVRSSSR